jgi:DNA-binding GntR family transcriptional regulator
MHTARDLPVWGSLKRRTSTAERRAAYHQKHIEIVSALNDRDPLAAETAMGIHLRDLAVDLLGRPDQAWTTPSSTY